MVKTMGSTQLDLRDYACPHVTIHCGPNQNDNVMLKPLITTILTQYHVSKGLKFFGDPIVAAVLKELKQLHGRMVMDPKMLTKRQRVKKGSAPIFNVFEAKYMRKNKGKGMRRWQKTAQIPHQGRYKCAKCVNGSPFPHVSHQRHIAPQGCNGIHTWSVYSGIHGR